MIIEQKFNSGKRSENDEKVEESKNNEIAMHKEINIKLDDNEDEISDQKKTNKKN